MNSIAGGGGGPTNSYLELVTMSDNLFTLISLGARKKAPTGGVASERMVASEPLVARKAAPLQPPRRVSVQGFPRGCYSGKTYMFHVTKDMCRGEIQRQGGSKLCVETDCEVEAHQQTRVAIPEEGAIFLKVPGRTRANQVFTHPMVPVDKLPLGMTLQTLEKDLQQIEALHAFMNTLISEDKGKRTTEEEWDDASSLLTPDKLRSEIG